MAVKRSRKRFAIIGVVVLLVLGGIVTTFALSGNNAKKDPYVKDSSTKTTNNPSDGGANNSDSQNSQSTPKNPDAKTDTQPTPDPTTVATIDVAQLNITVSYVKGINGFSYQIQRAPDGSQYVEFYSDALKGTKCSDDEGQFASILVNPDSNEKATVAKSTVVDGTTYGLSLSATACTSSPDLLAQYQKSFSDAFSLLKKTN